MPIAIPLQVRADAIDDLQAAVYGIVPPTWPPDDPRCPVGPVVIVLPQTDRRETVDARGRPV